MKLPSDLPTFLWLCARDGWNAPGPHGATHGRHHAVDVHAGRFGLCLAPVAGGPLARFSESGDVAAVARHFRTGHAAIPAGDAIEPPGFASEGTWFSGRLDSGIHRCQWHRIELDLAQLPQGTEVTVYTYSGGDDVKTLSGREVPAKGWLPGQGIRFQGRPMRALAGPPTENARMPGGLGLAGHGSASDEETVDCLVQSREGQHLWIKLELRGNGYATPVVRALRVHFPRASYVSYLPAVYHADDESRGFLERFLSIFQTEWDALDAEIDDLARHFDPAAVPEGPSMDRLARWLGLPLEGTWSAAQRRRMLAAVPRFYRRRGTPAAMAAVLRVYIENMAERPPAAAASAFPIILEGFRERNRFLTLHPGCGTNDLPGDPTAAVDAPLLGTRPLWRERSARAQVGGSAPLGEAIVFSIGDPGREAFDAHAHGFRVFVPAAWVNTEAEERTLRRAIEAEKPAHTRYTLHLVPPRLRVGRQSTIGVDTIIGRYPVARLTCGAGEGSAPGAGGEGDHSVGPAGPAPSAPPAGHLGYDTVLADRHAAWAEGAERQGWLRLAPGVVAGPDTVIESASAGRSMS